MNSRRAFIPPLNLGQGIVHCYLQLKGWCQFVIILLITRLMSFDMSTDMSTDMSSDMSSDMSTDMLFVSAQSFCSPPPLTIFFYFPVFILSRHHELYLCCQKSLWLVQWANGRSTTTPLHGVWTANAQRTIVWLSMG